MGSRSSFLSMQIEEQINRREINMFNFNKRKVRSLVERHLFSSLKVAHPLNIETLYPGQSFLMCCIYLIVRDVIPFMLVK